MTMDDKLNFPDLTKIPAPVILWDDDTKTRMQAHVDAGGSVEMLSPEGWFDVFGPHFAPFCVYRAKPEPLRPASPPWDVIDEQFVAWAIDKSGAEYFLTEIKFRRWSYDSHWDGRSEIFYSHGLKFDRGNMPWDQSLVFRPGYDGGAK